MINNSKTWLFYRPLSHKPFFLTFTFSVISDPTNLHPPRQLSPALHASFLHIYFSLVRPLTCIWVTKTNLQRSKAVKQNVYLYISILIFTFGDKLNPVDGRFSFLDLPAVMTSLLSCARSRITCSIPTNFFSVKCARFFHLHRA